MSDSIPIKCSWSLIKDKLPPYLENGESGKANAEKLRLKKRQRMKSQASKVSLNKYLNKALLILSVYSCHYGGVKGDCNMLATHGYNICMCENPSSEEIKENLRGFASLRKLASGTRQ